MSTVLLARPAAGHRTGERLAVLAGAEWPTPAETKLAPAPGFVSSTFGPLVAHVGDRCLRQVFGPPPVDPVRGERVAVMVVSVRGDLQTATATADALAHMTKVQPLLFFQSVPNAAAGRVAATWGLGGPVACTSPVGDPLDDALELVDELIADGDADEALVVLVEQACLAGEADRAVALFIGRWPDHTTDDPTARGERT